MGVYFVRTGIGEPCAGVVKHARGVGVVTVAFALMTMTEMMAVAKPVVIVAWWGHGLDGGDVCVCV